MDHRHTETHKTHLRLPSERRQGFAISSASCEDACLYLPTARTTPLFFGMPASHLVWSLQRLHVIYDWAPRVVVGKIYGSRVKGATRFATLIYCEQNRPQSSLGLEDKDAVRKLIKRSAVERCDRSSILA